MRVIGALLLVLSLAAPAEGSVFHYQCVVITEDRDAPSWLGWGDGPTEAVALAAAIRAACDPAPENERSTCRARARFGRVMASLRRGSRARNSARAMTTVYVEIEVYRDKARIEALGRAWGTSTTGAADAADVSPVFRQACYRALEKACALVGAHPASENYPLDADRGVLACAGRTWQIAKHQWAGQVSEPEGARFVPDEPKVRARTARSPRGR